MHFRAIKSHLGISASTDTNELDVKKPYIKQELAVLAQFTNHF